MCSLLSTRNGLTVFLLFFAAQVQTAVCDEPDSSADTDDAAVEDASRGLLIDRKTVTTLQAARDYLQAGNTDAAFYEFRRLQTADPSTMVPSASGSEAFVPLFRVLFDLFFDFPEDVRQRQSARDANLADQTLDEILESGDLKSMPQLIQEMPGTAASIQSHLILARLHVAQGHYLAARAWLVPLLKDQIPSAFRDGAANVMDQLQADGASTELSESTPPTATDREEPAKSLDNVVVPTHLRWQFHPLSSPSLGQRIRIFRDAARQASVIPETTWRDTVDGDVLYRRTLRGVAAIDLKSGQPQWHYPLLPALDGHIEGDRTLNTANANVAFSRLENTVLANLFCRDNVLGRVSSDSEQLYVVASEEGAGKTTATVNRAFGRRMTTPQATDSRLIALEKATGRRVWTTSGETFGETIGSRSETFWMSGPPTPVRGRLYGVFEWNGEIQLGCLAATTGELIWNRLLAFPDQSIEKDPARRLWKASPVVDGGLIWCPTTTGWTVCVDQLTRSVLWASSMHDDEHDPVTRLRRGQPVATTPTVSINRRWPESRLITSGEHLIVLPHEAHEVVVLNALTGEQVRRLKVGPSAVFLHAADGRVVIAEPHGGHQSGPPETTKSESAVVRSLHVATDGDDWSIEIPAAAGVPTGRGVLRDGALLVPMSSGLVAKVSLQEKSVSVTEEVVLPVNGWGYLVASESLENDLLHSSPERLSRISQTESTELPQDVIEQATGLMAAKKWQEALDLLTDMPEFALRFAEAKSLRFECFQQLAWQDPQQYLPQLKAEATTPDQQLNVKVFEASWLVTQDDPAAAAPLLVEILKLRPARLSTPAPLTLPTPDLESQADSDVIPVTQSLLTWATSEYSRLLQSEADHGILLPQLEGVSPTVLLNIRAPAIRPQLHRYLDAQQTLSEASTHLLRHSIALAIKQQAASGNEAPDFSAEVAVLERLLDLAASSDRDQASVRAVQLLLNTAMLDLPPEFVEAAVASNSPLISKLATSERLDENFRSRMQSQFERWTDQPYHALPVGRAMSMPRTVDLFSALVSDDPFLREYKWSVMRGEYGRLQAERVASADVEQWSLPGDLKVQGTYTQQSDLLQRYGSMLLLTSFSGVAGISVLDQQVVWSRASTSVGGSFSSGPRSNFEKFDAGREKLPSHVASSMYQIAGVGDGWVCVRQKRSIEVVDVLSGITLWSADLPAQFNRVITSDDVVIVAGTAVNQTIIFDGQTGNRLEPVKQNRSIRKAIRGIGRWIVYWQDADNAGEHRLQWVDPLSGEQHREVVLADATRFGFLDDETLVGFNDNQKMLTVDLQTGETRRVNFRTEADAEVPEGDAPNRLWSAERVQVATDAVNFYFLNYEEKEQGVMMQPSGRNMLRFTGGVRAVDRETGEFRWGIAERGNLLATTDQPDLPLLVLIETTPIKGVQPVRTSNETVFRGVNKMTGTELFRQPVPSRYGLRYTWISSDAANTLDIGVYGSRIRMQGEGGPQLAP